MRERAVGLAALRANRYRARPMRIALFLPHVGVFGGVRRFLEIGNAWVAAGHEVRLYHPEGGAPDWLPFGGVTRPLDSAVVESSDVAWCGDAGTYAGFRSHRAARHVYYCVLEGDPGLPRAIADRGVTLAANSGPLRRAVASRARRTVLDGIGGIRLQQFRPDPSRRGGSPVRVLVNGRRSRPKKGTDLILSALRRLIGRVPPFETVLFDSIGPQNRQDPRGGAPLVPGARFVLNPTQAELVELYQSAHVFVAAERKSGWCNTALEALACGCALVCTRSGTTDFARDGVNARVVRWRHPYFLARALREVIADGPLRERLASAGPGSAEPWRWEMLAGKLLAQLEPPRTTPVSG